MTPVKKPKKRPKARRAYGSSLPAPSKTLTSGTALRSTKPMKRGGKKGLGRSGAELRRNSPLRKVNPDRLAKRRAEYRKKLAAYRRSETYRQVEARSKGACEWTSETAFGDGHFSFLMCLASRQRGDRLTHHHKRYGRQFGGAERPDDIIVLCDRHNAEAESKHPTRNRNYRRTA